MGMPEPRLPALGNRDRPGSATDGQLALVNSLARQVKMSSGAEAAIEFLDKQPDEPLSYNEASRLIASLQAFGNEQSMRRGNPTSHFEWPPGGAGHPAADDIVGLPDMGEVDHHLETASDHSTGDDEPEVVLARDLNSIHPGIDDPEDGEYAVFEPALAHNDPMTTGQARQLDENLMGLRAKLDDDLDADLKDQVSKLATELNDAANYDRVDMDSRVHRVFNAAKARYGDDMPSCPCPQCVGVEASPDISRLMPAGSDAPPPRRPAFREPTGTPMMPMRRPRRRSPGRHPYLSGRER